MRLRSLAALAGLTLVAVLFPVPGQDAKAAFGFQDLSLTFAAEDSSPATQAGSHPYSWTAHLGLNKTDSSGEELPEGSLKDLRIQLPPGLVGAPALVPGCSRPEFDADSCPPGSEVGTIELDTELSVGLQFPVYSLEPLPGNLAELGFTARNVPIVIVLRTAPKPPYNLIASLTNAPQAAPLLGSTLTLRGVPGGVPLLTLPRSCAPASAAFEANAWELPGTWVSASPPEPLRPTGCEKLGFAPTISVQPTTTFAHAPSGLDLSLDLANPALTSPTGTANADLAAATLQLPPQMTINPSLAAALSACSPRQLAAETPDARSGHGCPQAAKIGSAEVTTPLLEQPLAGEIFVATPDDPLTTASGTENPLDSLLALYVVLRDAERGVLFVLPLRLDANPQTGRLTAGLTELPALPFTHLALRFNSGPRAPLTTPPGCGERAIAYSLRPSSGSAPLAGEERFETTSDCGEPFALRLSAGTSSNRAGAGAPLVVDLTTPAGAANLSGLQLTLPPGIAADVAAVASCPESAAGNAACPPSSRVGYARVALGTGPDPLWIPAASGPESDVYLAGPYRGAPFSLLVSIPAAAGPFDLGRVILRAPVRIDPETSQVTVQFDGLPQIRDGIPLHYRAIRLVLDRPGFIRNPTSCRPMRISLAARATDDAADASARYQAADCGALPFRPRLSLGLSGGLARNGHPRVEMRIAVPPGQANLAAASFALPAGELLDIRHLRALCARELPAERCQDRTRVGRASVSSPLLADPLRGPIFLRAPSGRYPDLLVELRAGELHLRLHGRTVSSRGGRLGIRFAALPDFPLSRATLALSGGRRGFIVNSAALCGRHRRGQALLDGQNGKQLGLLPRVRLAGRC